jgi:16S rRNA (uracil1498-N3)-methyltransferase
VARRRFFVDEVRNGRAHITGESAHHLTRVLRVEAGQKYEISDNSRVWLAEVAVARKSGVEFTVVEELKGDEPLAETTLYLALIKFERFEWAVEKATELGVTRVVPLQAQRSERGLEEGARKRVERWRRIAHEASEQSRRLRAPRIDDPMRFGEMLGDAARHRVWLDERPGAPPLIRAIAPQRADAAAMAIGPEGGWGDGERQEFLEAGWTATSLGPSILRTETAVCAGLALLVQMRLTDTINEE